MRVTLNHLCEHKFKHIFHDTLNPICNCGKDIETSSHYLLHCPDTEYSQVYYSGVSIPFVW